MKFSLPCYLSNIGELRINLINRGIERETMFNTKMFNRHASQATKKIFKVLRAWVFLLFFLCNISTAFAFDTLAKSAIVFDELTNSVILEKEADKRLPPASMSKLMTLLLAFEALDDGRIDLDTTFRISSKASQKGGSKMFIEENQLVSVESLIRGIAVTSGNDACIALAEGLNGTEDSFVSRMNLKARDLGLNNTHFENSTGWPAPKHLMSVRDLLSLSIYIRQKYPHFYKYFKEKEFTWNGIKQRNRNPLLNIGIGTDGLKTGHTEEAGYGLVGSSLLGKRRISFVLAGLNSSSERKLEGEKIVKWAFRDFAAIELFSEGHGVGSAPVWIGEENNVELFTPEKIEILIPYGKATEVVAEVHVEIPVMAPIKTNDQIGTLKIIAPSFIPGREKRIIAYPLVSHSNIKTGGLLKKMKATAQVAILRALDFIKSNEVINQN